MVNTRALQIAFARHNAGIDRAKRAYYGEEVLPCGCSPAHTCNRHRGRAAADLLVATSEEECAHLLAVLDRPPVVAGDCETEGCPRPRDGHHRLCWGCRKGGAA